MQKIIVKSILLTIIFEKLVGSFFSNIFPLTDLWMGLGVRSTPFLYALYLMCFATFTPALALHRVHKLVRRRCCLSCLGTSPREVARHDKRRLSLDEERSLDTINNVCDGGAPMQTIPVNLTCKGYMYGDCIPDTIHTHNPYRFTGLQGWSQRNVHQ